jgi:hypothetical protein
VNVGQVHHQFLSYLICVLVVLGVLVAYPNAMEWRALKDLKIEMGSTEMAVEVLKGKVGDLMWYMDGLAMTGGLRGMRGNYTMGGLEDNGSGIDLGFGMENATVVGEVVEGI